MVVGFRYKQPIGWRRDNYRHFLAAKYGFAGGNKYYTKLERPKAFKKVSLEEWLKRKRAKIELRTFQLPSENQGRAYNTYMQMREEMSELQDELRKLGKKITEKGRPAGKFPDKNEMQDLFLRQQLMFELSLEAKRTGNEALAQQLNEALERIDDRVKGLPREDKLYFRVLEKQMQVGMIDGSSYPIIAKKMAAMQELWKDKESLQSSTDVRKAYERIADSLRAVGMGRVKPEAAPRVAGYPGGRVAIIPHLDRRVRSRLWANAKAGEQLYENRDKIPPEEYNKEMEKLKREKKALLSMTRESLLKEYEREQRQFARGRGGRAGREAVQELLEQGESKVGPVERQKFMEEVVKREEAEVKAVRGLMRKLEKGEITEDQAEAQLYDVLKEYGVQTMQNMPLGIEGTGKGQGIRTGAQPPSPSQLRQVREGEAVPAAGGILTQGGGGVRLVRDKSLAKGQQIVRPQTPATVIRENVNVKTRPKPKKSKILQAAEDRKLKIFKVGDVTRVLTGTGVKPKKTTVAGGETIGFTPPRKQGKVQLERRKGKGARAKTEPAVDEEGKPIMVQLKPGTGKRIVRSGESFLPFPVKRSKRAEAAKRKAEKQREKEQAERAAKAKAQTGEELAKEVQRKEFEAEIEKKAQERILGEQKANLENLERQVQGFNVAVQKAQQRAKGTEKQTTLTKEKPKKKKETLPGQVAGASLIDEDAEFVKKTGYVPPGTRPKKVRRSDRKRVNEVIVLDKLLGKRRFREIRPSGSVRPTQLSQSAPRGASVDKDVSQTIALPGDRPDADAKDTGFVRMVNEEQSRITGIPVKTVIGAIALENALRAAQRKPVPVQTKLVKPKPVKRVKMTPETPPFANVNTAAAAAEADRNARIARATKKSD